MTVTDRCPTCGQIPRGPRPETLARHETRVFDVIQRMPDLGWHALMRASGLNCSDATAARDRLIARGLVERVPGTSRAHHYRATNDESAH